MGQRTESICQRREVPCYLCVKVCSKMCWPFQRGGALRGCVRSASVFPEWHLARGAGGESGGTAPPPTTDGQRTAAGLCHMGLQTFRTLEPNPTFKGKSTRKTRSPQNQGSQIVPSKNVILIGKQICGPLGKGNWERERSREFLFWTDCFPRRILVLMEGAWWEP